MLKGKSLLDHTNWFSCNEYEKNDKKILKYFFFYLNFYFYFYQIYKYNC